MNEEILETADGVKLFTRSWRPEAAPRGMVVLVHGFNSHSGYYADVAQQLAELGLAVYALDLRGRGKSSGERFYIEHMAEYLSDVSTVMTLAKAREPALPVYILGHSAGGVISCLYALENRAELAGLICESFAFQLPAPDIALSVIKGLSHVAPHVHVLTLNKDDFSRDATVVAAMKEDPLIKDEVEPSQTLAELVRAGERLKREFSQITLPVLILHGTNDKVSRAAGSQLFFDQVGSPDKTLKLYENGAHDLLNDLDKEQVLADISSWLVARLPPAAVQAAE